MRLLHAVKLTATGDAPTLRTFIHADLSATRDGWTVTADLGHFTTALLVANPDGDAVAISAPSPGSTDLRVVFAGMPVHDLNHAFDPAAQHHNHAWECLQRLHSVVASLPAIERLTTVSDRERKILLSWASVTRDVMSQWQEHAATSGITALELSRLGITPQQAEPFFKMGWVGTAAWSRGDIACFIEHDLDTDDAQAWADTRVDRLLMHAFIRAGYTPEQAVQVHRACTAVGRPMARVNLTGYTNVLDWAVPAIRPEVAALAIRAGLTPDEAADPTLDEDAMHLLLALRETTAPVQAL